MMYDQHSNKPTHSEKVSLAEITRNEVPGGFFWGEGGGCLFPIETHITCDFPGGPDPISLHLEVDIFF